VSLLYLMWLQRRQRQIDATRRPLQPNGARGHLLRKRHVSSVRLRHVVTAPIAHCIETGGVRLDEALGGIFTHQLCRDQRFNALHIMKQFISNNLKYWKLVILSPWLHIKCTFDSDDIFGTIRFNYRNETQCATLYVGDDGRRVYLDDNRRSCLLQTLPRLIENNKLYSVCTRGRQQNFYPSVFIFLNISCKIPFSEHI
jgi:hypothetical protein